MFNNLIESSSHRREFKRRGSFFLFTVGAYALLFVVGGVVSIYAYDAHLDEQSAEITMLIFVPPDAVADVTPPAPGPHRPAAVDGPHSLRPTAPVLYESSSNPHSVPNDIGIKAQTIPAARPGTILGPNVTSPLSYGPSGPSTGIPGGSENRVAVDDEMPPAPPVVQKAVPQVIRKDIINGEAIELPKPPYPPMAKQTGTHGAVNVQVLIDESGKVISARAMVGNPLLIAEAVRAAYRARFSPTKIGDQPVKVSGIITYNFVLN